MRLLLALAALAVTLFILSSLLPAHNRALVRVGGSARRLPLAQVCERAQPGHGRGLS